MGKKKGLIYLFTGEGEGKTIAALGLALRAVGQGKKVIVIQFMKGRKDTGEYKIAKKLKPKLEIHQFGRQQFVNSKNPKPVDYELARKGFAFAQEIARKKRPFLLVLDEINLAVAIGLLSLKEVLAFLRGLPKGINVVLTGRRAPKPLLEIADGVTETKKIKHPYDRGIRARSGIEY